MDRKQEGARGSVWDGQQKQAEYTVKDTASGQVNALAGEVMQLARDQIIVNMRFLDVALSRL